jgi:predicted protein tyrosine phosphatase
MSETKKLLFVCSLNQRRSPTAERLFRGMEGYETRSVGADPRARAPVKQADIEWADLVFVMEPKHLQELRRKFKPVLAGKRLICLHIPDTYGFMAFELISALKEKLSLYVEVPR